MIEESKSEPTGNVYRFSTFQELVDRVPGNRIRDCMEELGALLASAKLSAQLVHSVARNLAKADGKELPTTSEHILVLPPELEWNDDGKGEIETQLQHENGEHLMSVKITKTK